MPCVLLVPDELERQVTEANADNLRCPLIVEAANGPCTPDAERMLATAVLASSQTSSPSRPA